MQFDASAAVQQQVRRSLGLDPRMIRFSVVKVGDKLGGKAGSVEDVSGKIPWVQSTHDEDLMRMSHNQGKRGASPMEF